MDTSQHGLEQCDSPMDAIHDAEMGEQQTPQPHHAETPDGEPDHSPKEVTDHFEEKNDACIQMTGTDAGQLIGKRDDLKSRQIPSHPVFSNQNSINEGHTMDNMEAERTQNKDTSKPEDTTVISKCPKKMSFDKLPDTPPERTRGASRRAAYKNGKD
jgi:hypothetical protein